MAVAASSAEFSLGKVNFPTFPFWGIAHTIASLDGLPDLQTLRKCKDVANRWHSYKSVLEFIILFLF